MQSVQRKWPSLHVCSQHVDGKYGSHPSHDKKPTYYEDSFFQFALIMLIYGHHQSEII